MATYDSQTLDKVPKTLKRLIRLAVSAFYGIEQGIIIDYLIHYPCLREDHLCELLKFERKFLRFCLVPLKSDKFIKTQIRIITTSKLDGQQVNDPTLVPLDSDPNAFKSHQNSHNYYYIDFHTAINVIRYKLDKIAETLEREESKASTQSTFICTAPKEECGASYTDLDVARLFDQSTGELYCEICGSLVILPGDGEGETGKPFNNSASNAAESIMFNPEDGEANSDQQIITNTSSSSSNNNTKRDIRKMITLFNTQCEPLFNLLKKVENVVLAAHLIKPEPIDIDLNNLANANFYSSNPSNQPGNQAASKNWKQNAKYLANDYEWYKSGGITINLQNDPSENNNDEKQGCENGKPKSKIPVWLAPDTSNIINNYQKRVLIPSPSFQQTFLNSQDNLQFDEDSRNSMDNLVIPPSSSSPLMGTTNKKHKISQDQKPHKKYRSYFKNIGVTANSDNDEGNDPLLPTSTQTTTTRLSKNRGSGGGSYNRITRTEDDITQTLLLYESEVYASSTSTLPATIPAPPDKHLTNGASSLKVQDPLSLLRKPCQDGSQDNSINVTISKDSTYDPELEESAKSLLDSNDQLAHHNNLTNPFLSSYHADILSKPLHDTDLDLIEISQQFEQQNHFSQTKDIDFHVITEPVALQRKEQPSDYYQNKSITLNNQNSEAEIIEIATVFPVHRDITKLNGNYTTTHPYSNNQFTRGMGDASVLNEVPIASLQSNKINNQVTPNPDLLFKNDTSLVHATSTNFEALEEHVIVNGNKIAYEDIDSTWLSKMSPMEREKYNEISRLRFEMLYDI